MLEWKAEFETGIQSADYEHRKLLEVINELHELAAGATTTLAKTDALERIALQFSAHFAVEEEVMRDAAYDDLPGHKADHERILGEIEEAIHSAKRGEDLMAALPARLEAWFVDHFHRWDSPLHIFLDRAN